MQRCSQRLKMLADAQAGTEKTRMVRTEFAMNARELDQGRGGDYWTTPHEMAARAFQGYVEDKIAEQGGTSRFLNYGPANASILTPWGFKRPFPSGQERVAINEAFDGFIKTLQTREDDAGNVALHEPDAPEYSAKPYDQDLFGNPVPAPDRARGDWPHRSAISAGNVGAPATVSVPAGRDSTRADAGYVIGFRNAEERRA